MVAGLLLTLVTVPEPHFDDPQHLATIEVLRETGLALSEGIEATGLALEVGVVRPLPQVAKRLGKRHAKRLDVQDGWAQPLYVAQASRHVVLGSPGPDGRIDVDLDALSAPGASLHDLVPLEADDLVWVDAILVANDLDVERARQRRTAWRLANIGSWVELHYLGAAPFPGAGRGAIDVNELEELLDQQGHGVDLPRDDAWGYPLTYATDGSRFVIGSPGPNRRFEKPPVPGSTGSDVLFWPEPGASSDDMTVVGPTLNFAPKAR